MSTAVKIYLFSYRNRWGDSGVIVCYTRKEQVRILADWLDEAEKTEFNRLLDEGKLDEAENWATDCLDSAGHEWITDEAVIYPAECEPVGISDRNHEAHAR